MSLPVPYRIVRPKTGRWSALLWVGALAWMFAVFGRGTMMSSDEGGIFNSGIALFRGSLAIPPGENVFPGREGKFYSIKEILPSIAIVPTVFFGSILDRQLASTPPIAPGCHQVEIAGLDTSNWPLFLTTTIVGPVVGAVMLLYLLRFYQANDMPAGLSIVAVLACGWATPVVVYTKTIFPQVFEAVALMAGLYYIQQWRARPSSSGALALGVAIGCGLLTRIAFAPVAVLFLAAMLLSRRLDIRTRLVSSVWFLLPLGAAILITCAVNWIRWGGFFDFGRGPNEQFTTPLHVGLYGLLFSPGKGLLVYAPTLWFCVVFGRSLWRRAPFECLLLISITAVYLIIYGQWYDWRGGLAWGPRFLLPLIAPWFAVAGHAWRRQISRGAIAFFSATVVVGVGIQWVGASVYPHWIILDHYPDPFSFTDSHLVASVCHYLAHGADDFWMQSVSNVTFWTIFIASCFAPLVVIRQAMATSIKVQDEPAVSSGELV